jgi:nitroreductase
MLDKWGAVQLYNLIIRRRTIRLFRQREVPLRIIKKVINSARLAPSAANLQFLEYLIIQANDLREKVFPALRWGGYVAPKRNPPPNNLPAVYIIILINKERTQEPNIRDIGAACENILLSLLAFGLGGCWLQNIDKQVLTCILHLPARYEIDSLIAAGYPAESPKLETDSDDIKYWLDDKNRLHVPKRPLKDIFHYNYI